MPVPLVIMAAGTAISAIGKYKAGKAAKAAGEAQQRAAESQAELLDYNASVADLQAQDAVARGAQEESRFRSQVRGAIGAQRAGFAGANIDVGYGSAVDVQADAAYLGELDALTIRTNAMREAWGYKVEAFDTRKRAEITRKEGVAMAKAGRVAQTAARFGAASTIVGGVGNLLQARYGFASAGGHG